MSPLVLVIVVEPWVRLETSPCFDRCPLFLPLQELQSLEHSNSAIQKDIDSLQKELDYYMLILERHKPFCCLKDAAPDGQSGSPAAVTQVSASPHTAGLSLLSPRIHPSTHPSFSTSTAAYDCCKSTSTFTTFAHTDCFNQLLASHSLVLGDSPPLTTLEGATAASTLPAPAAATSPPSRVTLGDRPLSAPFSAPASEGTSPRNQASSNAPLPCVHSAAENRGAVDSQVNVHQLVHLKHLQPMENSQHPSLPSSHLWPSPQSLSVVSAPSNSFGQNVPSESESLLSLLTTPPPIDLPQPDLISLPESFDTDSFPSQSQFDISADLSLSELLSTDDWILE